MTAALEFCREKHEYRAAGRLLPSVTQILGAVLPQWQAGEWYLQRGLALHAACEMNDRGDLDEASVHPEIANRLAAWRRFLSDALPDVVHIEMPLAHPTYKYAGTVDRVLRMDSGPQSHSVSRGELLVCDLKSTINPQVIAQLGGYSLMLKAAGIRIKRGVAVELRDDGEYRNLWIDRFELARAEQTFLAALTLFNFMQQHNLRGYQ